MKIVPLFLFFLFQINFASSQAVNLKDRAFISSFKETIFKFDKVDPQVSKIWRLVAGRCTKTPRQLSKEHNEQYNKGIDSMMAIINSIKVTDAKSSEKASNYIDQLQDLRDSFTYESGYNISYEYNSQEPGVPAAATKLCKINGFSTWCPPGYCNWFVLYYQKDRASIIDDKVKLDHFLGNIDNPYKAWLLLKASGFGESGSYPKDEVKIRYKKIGSKYYFIERLRLSDCPIQNFDCLISVDRNGEVKLVDKIKFGEDGGCI